LKIKDLTIQLNSFFRKFAKIGSILQKISSIQKLLSFIFNNLAFSKLAPMVN